MQVRRVISNPKYVQPRNHAGDNTGNIMQVFRKHARGILQYCPELGSSFVTIH